MLKHANSMKNLGRQGALELEQVLKKIPALEIDRLQVTASETDSGIDVMLEVSLAGQKYRLIGEVKSSGQPRFVREAILQLKSHVSKSKTPLIPIMIAPFLSAKARELCANEGVSFADFEGNCRIAFGPVYVEVSVPNRPAVERRDLKSLFKPRSAQVIRLLLRDPKVLWTLSDLSAASGVSIGHVSNVRTALINHEWAETIDKGFRISAPDALLDAWKGSYETLSLSQEAFYTPLHGAGLQAALQELFASISPKAQVALASFSAAQWIAPYGRTHNQYFYCDDVHLHEMIKTLVLSVAVKGENVVIWDPSDPGVFTDAFSTPNGLRCTSPLQTYLDLTKSGERGIEAAEHLRADKLQWPK